ncbi:kinesin-like protein KIN-4C isoform X2 [Quercus robur]|uniref:kinesin-like protein KIN-4C isoform X2 n=1 Tax=Quercus robur TaxID=38942 RepID=UPI002163094E|nr:kinesin-like protein KIN-4C isoform X2 [Quercus robur]
MATHLSCGSHSRATESTDMNDQSSCSHAIFTITMEQKKVAPFVAGVTNEDIGDDNICAKLLLRDLAGSECAKRTVADSKFLVEGKHIKKGLLALGKVINALGEKNRDHILYRESNLTRLLQDSLRGNSKTVMIACVRPAIANRKETLSTLKYANHDRNIQNKAVVLQRKTEKASMSTKSCIDYREKDSEIRDLKEKVATLSKYASKLEMEKAKLIHQEESLGYRSSSRLEDMDTSESEYLDDSDDDDWVPKSEEEEEKPVKKRICRTSVAFNPLDTLVCSSCSKNSSCKTIRCPCHASGRSCGTSCACKCANRRTVKGGSPEFQIHESIP